jgi:PAS domain S-box-containing protein
MKEASNEALLLKIEELKNRLEESEQLVEAIKAGEVDAFAITKNNRPEVYTLQSGDYTYRLLIEEFGEGAVNVTEEGLIVYTNAYFSDLIKIPYEKIIGTVITNFIGEDSKEEFNALFIQSLKGKSKGEINLKVNKKIIPVYISLTSLQPKLPTVGIIITDLTEKKKNEELIINYQKELEAKNSELIKSNTELASFAFIASHDLQEPLRKIQTFTNRLLEVDYESFSDRTRDYFDRISTASVQMQQLINALLDYSRLNTSDIVYTSTDLNFIIDTVRENLKELIEENELTIKVDKLPVLDIIQIQFIQLFSNLVTNAIKYKKAGVNPVLNISADIVNISEKPAAENLYWEIKVADNGIGFDPIYKEKIFELFQRLHGRTEYEGTGIGLAICKKIVQNHQGFINAEGHPGIGAIFNIYIPFVAI